MSKGKEWLKVEMKEAIEIELSHDFGLKSGKYISLYTLEKLIDQLDEPEKVVIPQFVADWIENHKKKDNESYTKERVGSFYWLKMVLDGYMIPDGECRKIRKYLDYEEVNGDIFKDSGNVEKVINAWNGSYKVEEVKYYRLKLINKTVDEDVSYLNEIKSGSGKYFLSGNVQFTKSIRNIFSETELADIDETGFKRVEVTE